MRKYLTYAVALGFLILFLPAIPVYVRERSAATVADNSGIDADELENMDSGSFPVPDEKALQIKQNVSGKSSVSDSKPYKVLDVSSGQVIDVPVKDYIIGAVCAEMPATFEPEALKAQAVAAHTYAERQRMREKKSPTAELYGADFSNDTSKYQGYFTLNQIKQFYGDNFDLYYKKVSAAANEVSDFIITYHDEPIVSAFCSMSSGKTESAENAWGSPVDYLISVDSSFDTSAPKYLEETAYSKDVLQAKLSSAFPTAKLGDDFTKWLEVKKTSDAGTVLEMRVGDITVSGSDMRSALALRSAAFVIKFTQSEVVFDTKGYGHGVGMSQYGANAMASQGSSWQDILNHYYSGCSIVNGYL